MAPSNGGCHFSVNPSCRYAHSQPLHYAASLISTIPVEQFRTTRSTPFAARSTLCVTHPAELRTTRLLESKLPSTYESSPSLFLAISPFRSNISSKYITALLL